MKQNTMTLARTGGEKDFEEMVEDLKAKTHNEAYDGYQKFMNKATGPRADSNDLLVQAYEGILTHERREEREQLNRHRFKEYERNRPPADKWYELKNSEFSKELYRNRVALKPNNQNKEYLDILQDKYLY